LSTVTSGQEPLLSVRELSTHFFTPGGAVKAVDEVSFDVPAGKTVALVGESGCGKTVTAYSLLRLVPPPGRIVGGEIVFEGRDLLRLSEREMRALRGDRIAMVFQEPMTSLNPVFTVGEQIAESIRVHRGAGRRAARAQAIELLSRVRMPSPEARVDEYPHQLSGGMRQRVMIAMALACDPRLLIADEPTTALDVTIQAQILQLLRDLQAETGMSVLFITHDFGIVAETADEVVVMYAARVVERAGVRELFSRPLHPYTLGLFASLPALARGRARLSSIPGSVPDPLEFPPGCRFHPRCGRAIDACSRVEPTLRELCAGHFVACDVLE
jgi:oligopeptide/dipeptide ABC transporter ATP-binding protein